MSPNCRIANWSGTTVIYCKGVASALDSFAFFGGVRGIGVVGSDHSNFSRSGDRSEKRVFYQHPLNDLTVVQILRNNFECLSPASSHHNHCIPE